MGLNGTHLQKQAQGERVPMPHKYIARVQPISDVRQIQQPNC